MLHEMKLHPKYYDYILKGTKRIEIRLNDEKRQKIKIGDFIEFKKEPEFLESFKVRVSNIFKYQSLAELVAAFDVSLLADSEIRKEELLSFLEEFYTEDLQKVYGVIGIEIELI